MHVHLDTSNLSFGTVYVLVQCENAHMNTFLNSYIERKMAQKEIQQWAQLFGWKIVP